MRRGIAFSDGGNRGAPGPHACAAVLTMLPGLLEYEVTDAKYLGDAGTNNIAEWSGLIMALKLASAHRATHLLLNSDSELVVFQALGKYRVKQEHLKPLYAEAMALLPYFQEVRIKHVRRELNRAADALCTKILDEKTGRIRGDRALSPRLTR